MALFKEMRVVRPSSSATFDKLFRPGTEVVFEGIYRCQGCNTEKAIPAGRLIPKDDVHPDWCENKTWKLVVAITGATKNPW